MKLSSIQFLPKLNINSAINRHANSPIRQNQSINRDILDINFTSKPKAQASDMICAIITGEKLRDKVVSETLVDSQGNYSDDAEQTFVALYSFLCINYKQEYEVEEIEPKTLRTFLEAANIVLKTLKNDDATFNIDEGTANVALSVVEAMEADMTDIEAMVVYSKDESNGYVDDNLLDLFVKIKTHDKSLSCDEMVEYIKKYFVRSDGKIDVNDIPKVMDFFAMCNAKNSEERDLFYTLIIDEKSDMDEKRFIFAYNAIEKMQNMLKKEVSKDCLEEFDINVKRMLVAIVGLINEQQMRNNRSSYSLEKAQLAFDDWLDSVQKTNFVYDENGKIKKALSNPGMQNGPDGKKHLYNSTVFRLFNVLYN